MSDLPVIPLRHELKYVVSEPVAAALRAALAPFCAQDENSARAPGGRYRIQNLYFDTPARDLHRVSREERPVRFKVRARRYAAGDDPSAPVFLEVKHKQWGLVRKTRAVVPFDGWAARAAAPAQEGLAPAEGEFRRALARHGLVPTLLLRYEREAFFSLVDSYARVTLDRDIRCQPADGWSLEGAEDLWLALDGPGHMKGLSGGVLVELKCAREVPLWMSRLVERLSLRRTGFSKYCNGIERYWGRDVLEHLFVRTATARG